MEIAFIVVYAAILGLVAPYIGLKSEKYGSLVPGVSSFVLGAILWASLTWLGFPATEAWIWVITMFSMPAAMWFVPKRLEKLRS
ncbi:MAG: hypothetical protein K9G66_02770 [Rhodoluna sp.]|jgi:hypothetical protein|nr:hypothetical protein [Rhodoluna sp.]